MRVPLVGVIRAHKRPFLYVIAAALTLSVLGTACSMDGEARSVPTISPVSAELPPPASGQPKRGGTLRVAVVKGHTTFDPQDDLLSIPAILFSQQFYDNLVLRDPDDLSLIPMLAESWEPNDDLTQYTFHLRPGVKFHHGKEFTAEDVVFTFN